MDKNELDADAGTENRSEGQQEAQEGASTLTDVNMNGLEEKALGEANKAV